MIDVQVRIHDRFSVEFKISYVVRTDLAVNDFMMNTWVFVPNSLDINSFTYSKNQFYRDVKSNVRLITPIYDLSEVADYQSLPFMFFNGALNELRMEPDKEHMADCEYQMKMFTSIVRSALRREVNRIVRNPSREDRLVLVVHYKDYIEKITTHYRELRALLKNTGVESEAQVFLTFGDEFLGNLVQFYTLHLLDLLKVKAPEDYTRFELLLIQLVKKEFEYKLLQGYKVIEKESEDNNRAVAFRIRLLKKYTESHLFLKASKKKDGRMAEQVYYSLAAGLSMIFATAIAFSFQQKYGNYTMPLFVALVVSYMLKDRIKELTRFYFVHRLAKRYFDNKTTISIKDTPIGWIKEGVDFITEERVPEEVMAIRNRSDLLEANNRNTAEKIILYRKLVRINGQVLDEKNQYDISGINDIVRFNVSNYVLKMDNPDIPLNVLGEDGGYETVKGERIYYINFLIQLRYENNIDYKRFRLVMSRNGIEGIEKF